MNTLRCDILILGAGPAGMAAALSAAACDKQVIILDDNPAPGGQIWRAGPQATQPALARRYRDAIAASAAILLVNGARLIARPSAHSVLFETADGGGVVYWQKLILCCGARELSLPFPGWTLPGVTGAGGLQAQIKQGLALKGEKVVIAGSGPLLLAVADTVNKAGGEVTNIIEQAPLPALLRFAGGLWRWPQKLRQLATLAPKGYLSGTQVNRAHGTTRLEAVTLRQRGVERTIACDRLAIGYGLIPNIETALLFGCATAQPNSSATAQEAIQVNRWQQTSIADIYAAGECTGFGGSELALAEGEIAGFAAAGASHQAQALFARRARWQRFADAINRAFRLAESLKNAATPESLLCRCEDVRCGDVAAADDWLQAKLTQRCGMGACQGRTCAASARWLYGWPLPQPREPLSPARAETLIALARLSAEP
ncbi:NAD(P)/FAD-dependent oxidoreductase [Klebsiella pneumoniae]|uniref:NAD(P)/FAD-dependent oxidoreductase n=1 Tax=Klebsiella pneumoniae TaxID=573 RepID=UPI000C1DDC83|nr:FAD/NAD(P)-binding oxidoreductase [Klebsiella pneumoniae]HDU5713615.1 NAD(P)/FAD-dependent oxidoreductase [Klebsiella pneumoniae subsp. pneumoniae]MBD7162809.1 NAD(P)/FAD-dependent oxidoreductase [Klebsiella pneumoniae]MCW8508572.1 NAD(P)/FAD-dependent oxidoreductase [Klebsiella pneumoniae]SXC29720.1 pyridine nucleotide-disulfide oxidoreductase [Klebsiella pneumoniae]HBR1757225.1 NAD(P)/FAD-dependent oxidoreductase [Klebsiella pneumoniae]